MHNRSMIKCHLSAQMDKNRRNARNSEGTTFGSITKDDLFSLKPTYPNSRQLKACDAIVSKYNDMIFINSNENQQLSQLRDWLLPMLMNGQVTVYDQSVQAK